MNFYKLNFADERVEAKVRATIALATNLLEEGPRPLAVHDLQQVVGQGGTAQILRTVFVMVKSPSNKSPAIYDVNTILLKELLTIAKSYLESAKREVDIDEVMMEASETRIRYQNATAKLKDETKTGAKA